jgi:hypothetical protein
MSCNTAGFQISPLNLVLSCVAVAGLPSSNPATKLTSDVTATTIQKLCCCRHVVHHNFAPCTMSMLCRRHLDLDLLHGSCSRYSACSRRRARCLATQRAKAHMQHCLYRRYRQPARLSLPTPPGAARKVTPGAVLLPPSAPHHTLLLMTTLQLSSSAEMCCHSPALIQDVMLCSAARVDLSYQWATLLPPHAAGCAVPCCCCCFCCSFITCNNKSAATAHVSRGVSLA